MKITFGTFNTSTGIQRIYVNGTTRDKIWFEADANGAIVGKSDALRPQPNTSSLSVRRTKDLEALTLARKEIAAFFGKPSKTVPFKDLWEAACSGMVK